jgi:hypothetical protein
LKVRLAVALAAMSIAGTLVAAAPAVAGTGSPATSEAQPPASTRHFTADVQAARDYTLAKIGAAQFKCLDTLFERESHWNPRAHNARTGAHGIPQAVPGSKMGRGWQTDPMVQVRWGLKYVHGRYGTACSALRHAYATGWY